jgi:hypothetical protein
LAISWTGQPVSDQKIDAAVAVMIALGRAMTEDNKAGVDDFLSNPLVL